jgi:hypothetical protein
MTRKLRPNSLLNLAVLFIAILIALAALAAVSQAATVRFAKAVTYPSDAYWVYSVAVGDLNGDGHPDVVVANLSDTFNCYDVDPCIGRVSVLLGNGDGTLQPAVVYNSGGYNSWSVAIGDVNGDEHPDLVVANGCQDTDCNNGSVSVLLGNGDGTFQPAVSYSWAGYYAYSVAIADLNGDGKPDLVVGSGCNFYNCGNAAVGVSLGNGDGTFKAPVTYSLGGLYANVAIGDLNGDGRPDVVVANGGAAVLLLLGNGDGTLQAPVSYGSGECSNSVAIADVNGDGKSDLLVANCGGASTVSVLLGNGDGTFQPATSYPAGGGEEFPAVADLNGDGHLDVAVVGDGVNVLVGNGDGTFQAPVNYNSGGIGSDSIAVTDLDSDGRPDIVVGNWASTVGVLRNTFSAKTTTAITSSLNPSFVNQSVTFTATVTSTLPVPDGQMVTFYDGTTVLSSVALVGGTAAYSTSSLSGKTHYIKARYSGNAFFKPSTGSVTQEVLKYPTTTALTSSLNPSPYGQPVTFTATVTPSGPYAPTGKVKFWDGTTGVGTATLSGGVAKLTKSKLAVGTHSITAEYLGDADNAKSTSPVLDQVVQ